jgi:hypothetical protein
MLHAQKVVPLPRQCRAVILFFIFFFREIDRIFKFLYITYTKTTTLIKAPFGTPCGSHESMRQQCDILCMQHERLIFFFQSSKTIWLDMCEVPEKSLWC